MNSETPARARNAATFFMPAEWAKHAATWIAWPHNKEDWPNKFEPIPWVYGEIVKILSRYELVRIIVNDLTTERNVEKLLKRVGCYPNQNVRFSQFQTDRVWTRDSGATFVHCPDGGKTGLCWKFNAWAKYENHQRDARIGEMMTAATNASIWHVVSGKRPVVMEGGAIDVDGEGRLICTEECLLSTEVQVRNPWFSRQGYEKIFVEVLGAKNVIWLDRGIVGDDTHGHVDDVARFFAPGRVLICEETNVADENHLILRENLDRLLQAGLDVTTLPMPKPIVFDGLRVPASYANFYIANGVVLVPTFNDPKDREALGIIAECFPDRDVIGIYSGDLIWGLGTLHCATQQEPA